MATQAQLKKEIPQTYAKAGPARSEKPVAIKVTKENLPTGLFPPSFPDDYLAGVVAPFLRGSEFVGETPHLPIQRLEPDHEQYLGRR
jgi:hypothetical protein